MFLISMAHANNENYLAMKISQSTVNVTRHVVIAMIVIMIDEFEDCQNLTINAESLSPDALHCTPSSSARPVIEETMKETDMVGTDPATDQSCLHHEVSVP